MGLLRIDTCRRALKLPTLLEAMIESGGWIHPGEEILREKVPFITDPLIVLKNFDHMLIQSGPLMGQDATENERFSEYRGSHVGVRDLPWIDVERTLFIMCNERIGDDVGIALDYRYNSTDPRVIGGDWHSSHRGIVYRLVASNFAEFAALLGFPTQKNA